MITQEDLNRCDICGKVQEPKTMDSIHSWIIEEADAIEIHQWKVESFIEDRLKDMGKERADEACQECLERLFEV